MDYKEEYQKALERAKKGLPIDEVFPELKESEDERIRKMLIEIVSAWKNREPHGFDNVKYISNSERDKINKILAWLEKKKEQKPAERSEEDEEMKARVIRRYTDYEDVIMRTKEESIAAKMLNAMEQEEVWLHKSLRPQPQWKPSEEQN